MKRKVMSFYNGNELIISISIDDATTENICATKDWLAYDLGVDVSSITTKVEYRQLKLER